jgi:hypothetical protein
LDLGSIDGIRLKGHLRDLDLKVIYHDERIRLALQHETLETIYKEAVQSNRSKFLSVLPNFLKPQPYQELFIMGGSIA